MTSQTKQYVYGTAAVIGIAVTWYWNIRFMIETGGFSLTEFVSATYANAAAASISNDILVAVFTFLFWSYHEARKLNMRNWWAYPVLTFTIAIAFAFPLFMLMRERKLASRDGATAEMAISAGT